MRRSRTLPLVTTPRQPMALCMVVLTSPQSAPRGPGRPHGRGLGIAHNGRKLRKSADQRIQRIALALELGVEHFERIADGGRVDGAQRLDFLSGEWLVGHEMSLPGLAVIGLDQASRRARVSALTPVRFPAAT